MWLLHVDDEPVQDRIDINSYELPPNEAVEIPDHHARLLIEHKQYHGVVEVNAARTARGIELDLDEARARAQAALIEGEQKQFALYIEAQLERVQQGSPPFPPTGRIAKIVERRGINLADYGIHPVGFKVSEVAIAREKETAALREENRQLKSTLEEILQRLDNMEKAKPKAAK